MTEWRSSVCQADTNTATDSNLVPYSLTLKKVPRRFVTRFTSTGAIQIQFGAGVTGEDDSTITPDPTNVGLPSQTLGVSKIDVAYDPSNFMFTGTYGLAPSSTLISSASSSSAMGLKEVMNRSISASVKTAAGGVCCGVS